MRMAVSLTLVASMTACLFAPAQAGPSALNVAEAKRAGLSDKAAVAARQAWRCAKPANSKTFSIIDFSQDSTQKRLYVIDVATGALKFHELVTHGKNTGGKYSRKFSNISGSHQSSLGLYRTAEPYNGQHGYSLRLDGLERGINDKARARAIVMHGAKYATQKFVDKYGRLGRSWGCPAVAPEKITPIVDTIKNGSLLLAYYPDKKWLSRSRFLSCK